MDIVMDRFFRGYVKNCSCPIWFCRKNPNGSNSVIAAQEISQKYYRVSGSFVFGDIIKLCECASSFSSTSDECPRFLALIICLFFNFVAVRTGCDDDVDDDDEAAAV